MKSKFLWVASLLMIALLAGACGPAPEPTLSVSDIQNTAVALSWTSIAMTQAALPTATPVPPTSTPLPTPTPFPTLAAQLPTLAFGNPVVNASPTASPCDGPPPFKPVGTQAQVKLVNKSGGAVNLSLGMLEPNSSGECGTYSFSLGIYDAPVEKVLEGCYWAYAWITGNKPSTAQSTYNLCFDTSQTRALWIGTETIGFH